MNWKQLTIGDLGTIVTGTTPSKKEALYFDGDFPFLTPTDLSYDTWKTDTGATTVTDLARDHLGSRFVPAGAVLFTCIASVGKIAIARRTMLTNQQINSVVPGDTYDCRFVYYLLKHHTPQIQQYATGVATPIINKTTFGKIPIRVPNLPTQRRIADILSAYDDLIENNNRRMALLEESIHLLYREWFVYLRFPGHERVKVVDGVPEGWRRTTIGDALTLHYGKSLKQEARIAGDVPVYGSSGVIGWHNKALVDGNGIVVGRKGNVGTVFWSSLPFFPIDTAYYVSPDESSMFIYALLSSQRFVSSDAAVPGLNRNYAYSKEILVPPITVVNEFNHSANIVWRQREKLHNTNQKLREARDLLLPRLMDGRIPV